MSRQMLWKPQFPTLKGRHWGIRERPEGRDHLPLLSQSWYEDVILEFLGQELGWRSPLTAGCPSRGTFVSPLLLSRAAHEGGVQPRYYHTLRLNHTPQTISWKNMEQMERQDLYKLTASTLQPWLESGHNALLVDLPRGPPLLLFWGFPQLSRLSRCGS